MTEDVLLERMARIEAKKEYNLKRIDEIKSELKVCFP
jgi:hypothetical protein